MSNFMLKNLSGIKKVEIDADVFHFAIEIKEILAKGIAAATADDNGALSIWIDDNGYYRCEAQRYCKTIDSRIYTHLKSVIKWATKWLEEIK